MNLSLFTKESPLDAILIPYASRVLLSFSTLALLDSFVHPISPKGYRPQPLAFFSLFSLHCSTTQQECFSSSRTRLFRQSNPWLVHHLGIPDSQLSIYFLHRQLAELIWSQICFCYPGQNLYYMAHNQELKVHRVPVTYTLSLSSIPVFWPPNPPF